MESDEQLPSADKLRSQIRLCKEFSLSATNYINYSARGLEAMVDSAYGVPNSSSMINLYEDSEEHRGSLPQWTSQLGQDALAAALVDMKEGGFFIEIGCGNGTIISNTYSLETFLGWKGLLVEPNTLYCKDMRRTRSSIVVECAITADATKKEITLISGNVYGSCKEDTLEGPHAEFLKACKSLNLSQTVRTIEPKTLCIEHKVPKLFDYLSLDIEGGELDIILAWPFSSHRPLLLSVEHNYGPDRMAIRTHLVNLGYSVFGIDFDDFFVANELLDLKLSYDQQLQEQKMNSHTEPPFEGKSSSTSCYRSRLLATNWALRDQFHREIQRIKNDSDEMLNKANQHIASLENTLESIEKQAHKQTASILELIEEQAHKQMPAPKDERSIRPFAARLFNKAKAIMAKWWQ